MARPTKLTPETQKRICDALRAGNTRKAAVAYGGVDFQTFLNWMMRGEKAKSGEFFEFLDQVTRAESECEVAYVAVIKKAATGYDTVTTRTKRWREKVGDQFVQMEESVTTVGREFDWKAAESWLKRRRKEDWSERSEVTGANSGPVEVLLTRVSTPIKDDAPD